MSDAVTISDDYAVLHAGGLRFYFGYEYTTAMDDDDESGEWCFVVHEMVKPPFVELMRIPESKLGLPSGTDPVEFLLEGIARWMDRQVESR